VTNQGVTVSAPATFRRRSRRLRDLAERCRALRSPTSSRDSPRSLPGDDDGFQHSDSGTNRRWIACWPPPVFSSTTSTGALLESDIFFNSAFSWSVAKDGERAKWDIESIALHEIGHFSGLGHSAIGETELMGGSRRVLSTGAVMFPIALGAGDISGRHLDADDIAGISDLYPDNQFNRRPEAFRDG
jgi:hypothetical protein